MNVTKDIYWLTFFDTWGA